MGRVAERHSRTCKSTDPASREFVYSSAVACSFLADLLAETVHILDTGNWNETPLSSMSFCL